MHTIRRVHARSQTLERFPATVNIKKESTKQMVNGINGNSCSLDMHVVRKHSGLAIFFLGIVASGVEEAIQFRHQARHTQLV